MTDETTEATTAVPTETTETATTPDMVEKTRLDSVLNEMHQFKAEAKELKQQLATTEENKLKEQENWKTLYEKSEERRKTSEATTVQVQESYLSERKFSAIKEAALRSGIRPEAIGDLSLIGMDEVQIETTSTGKINVLGADTWVERQKTLRSHWFSDQLPPNVNTTTVGIGVPDGPVDWKVLQKLEKEGKRSGDMSKYHEAFSKYKQQR